MSAVRNAAAVVLVAVGLAACTSNDEASLPACPNIVVADDTAEVTKFLTGDGRDLIDVVMEARIAGFGGFCEVDIDDEDGGNVVVELVVTFQVSRGPANVNRTGQFVYFVAIADRNDVILAKQVFTSDVDFSGNRNRVSFEETLAQEIPLKVGELASDYGVYVGFQLVPNELQYNRRKLGR